MAEDDCPTSNASTSQPQDDSSSSARARHSHRRTQPRTTPVPVTQASNTNPTNCDTAAPNRESCSSDSGRGLNSLDSVSSSPLPSDIDSVSSNANSSNPRPSVPPPKDTTDPCLNSNPIPSITTLRISDVSHQRKQSGRSFSTSKFNCEENKNGHSKPRRIMHNQQRSRSTSGSSANSGNRVPDRSKNKVGRMRDSQPMPRHQSVAGMESIHDNQFPFRERFPVTGGRVSSNYSDFNSNGVPMYMQRKDDIPQVSANQSRKDHGYNSYINPNLINVHANNASSANRPMRNRGYGTSLEDAGIIYQELNRNNFTSRDIQLPVNVPDAYNACRNQFPRIDQIPPKHLRRVREAIGQGDYNNGYSRQNGAEENRMMDGKRSKSALKNALEEGVSLRIKGPLHIHTEPRCCDDFQGNRPAPSERALLYWSEPEKMYLNAQVNNLCATNTATNMYNKAFKESNHHRNKADTYKPEVRFNSSQQQHKRESGSLKERRGFGGHLDIPGQRRYKPSSNDKQVYDGSTTANIGFDHFGHSYPIPFRGPRDSISNSRLYSQSYPTDSGRSNRNNGNSNPSNSLRIFNEPQSSYIEYDCRANYPVPWSTRTCSSKESSSSSNSSSVSYDATPPIRQGEYCHLGHQNVPFAYDRTDARIVPSAISEHFTESQMLAENERQKCKNRDHESGADYNHSRRSKSSKAPKEEKVVKGEKDSSEKQTASSCPESALESEIEAEMTRARDMAIPVKFDTTPKDQVLNPDAADFTPTCHDANGNKFNVVTQKGISFFHPQPQTQVVPNPAYVIPTDYYSDSDGVSSANVRNVTGNTGMVCSNGYMEPDPHQAHAAMYHQMPSSGNLAQPSYGGVPIMSQDPAIQCVTTNNGGGEVANANGNEATYVYANTPPAAMPFVNNHLNHANFMNPETPAPVKQYPVAMMNGYPSNAFPQQAAAAQNVVPSPFMPVPIQTFNHLNWNHHPFHPQAAYPNVNPHDPSHQYTGNVHHGVQQAQPSCGAPLQYYSPSVNQQTAEQTAAGQNSNLNPLYQNICNAQPELPQTYPVGVQQAAHFQAANQTTPTMFQTQVAPNNAAAHPHPPNYTHPPPNYIPSQGYAIPPTSVPAVDTANQYNATPLAPVYAYVQDAPAGNRQEIDSQGIAGQVPLNNSNSQVPAKKQCQNGQPKGPVRNIQAYYSLMELSPVGPILDLKNCTLPYEYQKNDLGKLACSPGRKIENPIEKVETEHPIVRTAVERIVEKVRNIEQNSESPLTKSQLVDAIFHEAAKSSYNNNLSGKNDMSDIAQQKSSVRDDPNDHQIKDTLCSTQQIDLPVNGSTVNSHQSVDISTEPELSTVSHSENERMHYTNAEMNSSSMTFHFIPELQRQHAQTSTCETKSDSDESGVVISPTLSPSPQPVLRDETPMPHPSPDRLQEQNARRTSIGNVCVERRITYFEKRRRPSP